MFKYKLLYSHPQFLNHSGNLYSIICYLRFVFFFLTTWQVTRLQQMLTSTEVKLLSTVDKIHFIIKKQTMMPNTIWKTVTITKDVRWKLINVCVNGAYILSFLRKQTKLSANWGQFQALIFWSTIFQTKEAFQSLPIICLYVQEHTLYVHITVIYITILTNICWTPTIFW